uniref:RanBP2-type domain-containing protein n=1 Tax=Romanomermis culicivorax TaxID=13658 RepID=A0A915K9L8_ROMCU
MSKQYSGQRATTRRRKTNSSASILSDDGTTSGGGGQDSPSTAHYEVDGWECTVCTYRNKAESFRCEMCEVRKGTSTRKPRLNSTVVEQQQTVQKFVQQQQQAMIAQGIFVIRCQHLLFNVGVKVKKVLKLSTHKDKSRDRNSFCGTNSSVHDTDSPGPSHRSLESPLSCNSSAAIGGYPSSSRLQSISPTLSDAPPSPTPQLLCASPTATISSLTISHQNSSVSLCQMSPPLLQPITTAPNTMIITASDMIERSKSSNSDEQKAQILSPQPSCSGQVSLFGDQPLADISPQTVNEAEIAEPNNFDSANHQSTTTIPSTSVITPSTGTPASGRGRKKGSLNVVQRKPPITFFRKHVDQNSARTLAVTVNGLTVVITDYKLIGNPNQLPTNALMAFNGHCSSTNGGVPNSPSTIDPTTNGKNFNRTNKLKRKLKEKEQKINDNDDNNGKNCSPVKHSLDNKNGE